MRATWVFGATGLAAGIVLAALLAAGYGNAPSPDGERIAADRALAAGLLLDTPMDTATIDEAIRIADGLRRHYGIDTGRRHADRMAAAYRAQREVAGLVFSRDELEAAAAARGLSLDPARCGTTCRNVEALARVTLQQRALRAMADRPTPGS